MPGIQPAPVEVVGGAWAVVIRDWMRDWSHLSRMREHSMGQGPDLYILCDSRDRGEQIASGLADPFRRYSMKIGTGRLPIYAPTVEAIVESGFEVLCDLEGPVCDDRRMKAIHPPPSDVDIEFQWLSSSRTLSIVSQYRTGSGSIRTDVRQLPKIDSAGTLMAADVPTMVAQAYSAFRLRHCPGIVEGISCLPHVANIVKMLRGPAARGFNRWIRDAASTDVEGREKLNAYRVPPSGFEQDQGIAAVTFKASARDRRIRAHVRYRAGVEIEDLQIAINDALPDTLVTTLRNAPLHIVLGAAHLEGTSFGDGLAPKSAAHRNVVVGNLVPIGRADGSDSGKEDLPDLSGLRVDSTLPYVLAGMQRDDAAHVLRTLIAFDGNEIDAGPWLRGDASVRMIFSVGSIRCGDTETSDGEIIHELLDRKTRPETR